MNCGNCSESMTPGSACPRCGWRDQGIGPARRIVTRLREAVPGHVDLDLISRGLLGGPR